MQQGSGPPERSSQHPLPKHVPAQSDAHNSPVRQAEGQAPSRTQQTPQPIEGTTPESLPTDGSQSDGSAEMRDMDLFQQLGPRPMQSLAAGVNSSVEVSGQAAESRDSDMTKDGRVFQGHDSVSGHGYRQAKQSSAPTLPVVPEASAETGPGTAKDRRRAGTLHRSLLPAVHPRFRSSPLRTPAVAQSLGALPDQAAGPGSPGVRMGSSWNSSAKQGSLQHRLQQAARSQQGRLPAHANSVPLTQQLQHAASALQTPTEPQQQTLSCEERADSGLTDSKPSGLRPSKQVQQRRSIIPPCRPSSRGRTPVLHSACRGPTLDMQSVSAETAKSSATQECQPGVMLDDITHLSAAGAKACRLVL